MFMFTDADGPYPTTGIGILPTIIFDVNIIFIIRCAFWCRGRVCMCVCAHL